MAKLLGVERHGATVDRYWQHWGDDGRKKLTVETREPVDPIIASVRRRAQRPDGDFRFVASVPATMISDACRINAERWGISRKEAFAELMAGKTDRAKKTWRLFTSGRDLSRLQARSYR